MMKQINGFIKSINHINTMNKYVWSTNGPHFSNEKNVQQQGNPCWFFLEKRTTKNSKIQKDGVVGETGFIVKYFYIYINRKWQVPDVCWKVYKIV